MRVAFGLCGAALATSFVAWACHPTLEQRLDAASDATEIREASRNIIERRGEEGIDVVEQFAARRPDVAFDRARGQIMIHDPRDDTLVMDSTGPEITPATGDAELDRAILAATPESFSKLRLRPGKFEEIRLVEDANRAIYVIVTDSSDPLIGLSFQRGSTSFHEVDPETLSLIRRDGPR